MHRVCKIHVAVFVSHIAVIPTLCAGGLIFRGILESYPTHNITLIAIATPIAGQFGGECRVDNI